VALNTIKQTNLADFDKKAFEYHRCKSSAKLNQTLIG
jgi:hypothetical protein